MKYPHRKADNSEKAKFCHVCGQALIAKTICYQCKHENPEGFKFCEECGQPLTSTQASRPPAATSTPPPSSQPTSFANGRYQVKKFLSEGSKKKVYRAHDALLDRDVAFALTKTEKLDETALTRIKREAQAIGRLGDHPNIVGIYDLGENKSLRPVILLTPLAIVALFLVVFTSPVQALMLTLSLQDLTSGGDAIVVGSVAELASQ